jgi:DtxR family transcriptional regulator, Mn-dependent transcriptional regulator
MDKKSREDYLRIIYELDNPRSVDVAKTLNISKPSVSEMLRKLAKEDLIKLEPYSRILLTAEGIKKAKGLSDNHFIIKKFVEKFLGHNEQKTLEEAHKLEHALSKESVKIIGEIIKIENYKDKINLPDYIG